MIKIEDVSFTYPVTQKKAINHLQFEIDKGEIFGFLGPSGAGKTTTQRLIIGLLKGYNGHIHVMGKERSQWGNDFYEKIGVAFDFPNLYLKLTAYENLKLISNYYANPCDHILDLLDQVGLLKEKDVRVEHFSKGMKMRLNFVRSIMHKPDILFLDEPTSGLDPVNAKIIKDSILDLKHKGATVFLTTHHMEVAEQLCDRVAFINDGAISAIDSPSNLMLKFGKPIVTVGYKENGNIIQAKFPIPQLGENQDFLSLIATHEIVTMHSQEASLEEIFILLTGRSLL
jgi:fluoroquinolone transport system ATP-binding protein